MNTKPFSRVERVEQELLKIINQILSKDIELIDKELNEMVPIFRKHIASQIKL